METGNIANLTDGELRELESGDPDGISRKDAESKLGQYIENNPRDISALMVASGTTLDPFLRNHYVMSLVNIAKKGKDRGAYTLGIIASRMNNREDIVNELYLEMKREYPVRARIANFFSKLIK
jgi:hypothetical protein